MSRTVPMFLAGLAALALLAGTSVAQQATQKDREPDVIYVPPSRRKVDAWNILARGNILLDCFQALESMVEVVGIIQTSHVSRVGHDNHLDARYECVHANVRYDPGSD